MNNHKEQIKKFIVDNFLFGDSKKLKDDTDFFREGIVDSTGMIELVGFLESEFPIRVEDDELIVSNFSTLNSVVSYLQSKLNHKT